MPSPSTVLFGCLTGMNTLSSWLALPSIIVSSWYTTPVAPLVAVGFGYQVLHTSTLRFSETSLCSIACMRPELVSAECCDIHAVFVPLSASLVACRLRDLSNSVNSFTFAHRGGGALTMCNVSQLSFYWVFPFWPLCFWGDKRPKVFDNQLRNRFWVQCFFSAKKWH